MINLMGTGSNPSEAEGERALPNGPGSQVCSQDTALRVCWASWHLSRAPLEAHPAGEESSGWAGRVSLRKLGEIPGTKEETSTRRGERQPLWQALQSNVHPWGNSFLSLCSSILVREKSWRGECPICQAMTVSLLPDVHAAGIIVVPCQDPPQHPQVSVLSKAMQNKAPSWPGGLCSPGVWIYRMSRDWLSSFPFFKLGLLFEISEVRTCFSGKTQLMIYTSYSQFKTLIHNCHVENFTHSIL